MSNKLDDGGPAFPGDAAGVGFQGIPNQRGMSLRDWFAGQVLGGLVAQTAGVFENTDEYAQAVAHGSYAIADAMLAAQKGKGEA
jgi:hypothetical protein